MSTPAIAVIAAAQNAAQAIEDLLRNAGHDLRVQWLENAAAIENRTEIDPAGVICVHQTNIQSLESVIAECTRANTASLVIALAPTSSRLAVLEAGAWDAADPSEPALLTQALERALRGVAARQELIETRAALARTQMRLDTMLRESLDARATIEDGLHAQTNPGYARLFGFDEDENLAGVPLLDLVQPTDRDAVKHHLAAALKNKPAAAPLRFRGRAADDEPLDLTMQARRSAEHAGKILEILVRRAPPAIQSGPGISARTALYRALETAPADGCGLICLCLSGFQALQDRVGPEAADRLADEVSARLVDQHPGVRSFRYSATTFVVLYPAQGLAELEERARALQTLAETGDGEPIAIATAAILLVGDGDDGRRLLQTVRAARADAPGTNAVASDPLPDGQSPTTPAIEPLAPTDLDSLSGSAEPPPPSVSADPHRYQRLEKALESSRLALAYQPILSLEGEPATLLAAWACDQDDGAIFRADTMPHSEQTEALLGRLDRWLIRAVLAAPVDPQATVFVTLSSGSLAQADKIVDSLPNWLVAAKNRPRLLFAIPETAAGRRPAQAQRLAQALSAAGVELGLSDYTNQTGLLETLAPGFVRLGDASTEALVEDGDARVSASVRSAAAAGARVVAAPVADANGMARLWQAGVHYLLGEAIAQQPPG